jgi:uncharacterized protein YbaR (Trm112 family)
VEFLSVYERMTLYSIVSCQEKIVEGLIFCSQCDAVYPIIEGLPCFLLPDIRKKEIQAIEKQYLDIFRNSKK